MEHNGVQTSTQRLGIIASDSLIQTVLSHHCLTHPCTASSAGCDHGRQGIKQAGGSDALNAVVQRGKRKEVGERTAKAAYEALMRVL